MSLPADTYRAERAHANELKAQARANWSPEKRAAANAQVAAWREANRAAYLEGSRRYYAENADQVRAAKLAEYRGNPAAFVARNMKRKARLLAAVCEHGEGCVDAAFLASLYAEPCFYCGDETTDADHFVPLAKGGLHCRENLVPACEPCNASKHARHPVEFLVGVRGDQ